MLDLRRREFITLLGGAAFAWPLAARAQQPERMRRVGVLMSLAAGGKQAQARLAVFLQRLQELGWTDGRNVRIDIRWGTPGYWLPSRNSRGGAYAQASPGRWEWYAARCNR
jgi:hypothetical protein